MPMLKIADSAQAKLLKCLKREASQIPKPGGGGGGAGPNAAPSALVARPSFGFHVIGDWWLSIDEDHDVLVSMHPDAQPESAGQTTPCAEARTVVDPVMEKMTRQSKTVAALIVRYTELQRFYSSPKYKDKNAWRKPRDQRDEQAMLREIAVHMVYSAVCASSSVQPPVGCMPWKSREQPGMPSRRSDMQRISHSFQLQPPQIVIMYREQLAAHQALLLMVPLAMGMLEDRLKNAFAAAHYAETDVSDIICIAPGCKVTVICGQQPGSTR